MDKTCWIGLLKDTYFECKENRCSLWNETRQECSVKSFFQSWKELQMGVLRMNNTLERFEEEDEEGK